MSMKVTCKDCGKVGNSLEEWVKFKQSNSCAKESCKNTNNVELNMIPVVKELEAQPIRSTKPHNLRLYFDKKLSDVKSDYDKKKDHHFVIVSRPISTQMTTTWMGGKR